MHCGQATPMCSSPRQRVPLSRLGLDSLPVPRAITAERCLDSAFFVPTRRVQVAQDPHLETLSCHQDTEQVTDAFLPGLTHSHLVMSVGQLCPFPVPFPKAQLCSVCGGDTCRALGTPPRVSRADDGLAVAALFSYPQHVLARTTGWSRLVWIVSAFAMVCRPPWRLALLACGPSRQTPPLHHTPSAFQLRRIASPSKPNPFPNTLVSALDSTRGHTDRATQAHGTAPGISAPAHCFSPTATAPAPADPFAMDGVHPNRHTPWSRQDSVNESQRFLWRIYAS